MSFSVKNEKFFNLCESVRLNPDICLDQFLTLTLLDEILRLKKKCGELTDEESSFFDLDVEKRAGEISL